MLATAEPDTATGQDQGTVRPVRLLMNNPEAPDPHDRWWWEIDPSRTETMQERAARYLSDERPVDMHGMAVIIERSYDLVKDMRHEATTLRRIDREMQADQEHLGDLMARLTAGVDLTVPAGAVAAALRERQLRREKARNKRRKAGPKVVFAAEEGLRDLMARVAAGTVSDPAPALAGALENYELIHGKVKKDLLKALPAPRFMSGQSPTWWASDGFGFGRRTTRLEEWYEYAEIKRTGRPFGSRTVNRKAKKK